MKIVVGAGTADDYVKYAEAGADEIYFGFIPGEIYRRHGRWTALNRREVIYCNVQAGSWSEILIIKKMREKYGVPVSIALNFPGFDEEFYGELIQYVKRLAEAGFDSFIIADLKFAELIGNIKGINFTISGESGEVNRYFTDELFRKVKSLYGNFRRLIFPRQTDIPEIAEITGSIEKTGLETEAFVLNEKCHFTGAFCNSLHCDEMCHICNLPYRVACRMDNGLYAAENVSDTETDVKLTDEDVPGLTGCGLCYLWQLREAGVTHLKIVSRGNDTDSTVRDINCVKKALALLDESTCEQEYTVNMKRYIFPGGCSGNCYYHRT